MMKKVFTDIYNNNSWGYNISEQGKIVPQNESKSGSGSMLENTINILKEIPLLCDKLNIKSILDAPCGDFNWMKKFPFNDICYTGVDIITDLINDNVKNYGNIDNVKFIIADIVTDDLPKCDLILCRDCLVHLSYDNVIRAINNFARSGSTYILTTTFLKNRKNRKHMITGQWHPLNLLTEPFNFPVPVCIINEKYTLEEFSDKSLALWKLSDLTNFIATQRK